MPAGCNDLLECLDNRRVVPGAGQAPQFVDGFFGRLDGWTEHARLRDRVESITGVDDPRANWNFRSFQTVRVACAVQRSWWWRTISATPRCSGCSARIWAPSTGWVL